jgi:RNA ligase (TIGR02306 family)
MSDRKLVTVRTIAEIKAIDGADRICAYRVDGWWVIDSVGKYAVGELVVYAEPDSWIPTEMAPFLSKGKEPREYLGVKGEKLRSIKLKKQLSQGLLFPLSQFDFGEVAGGDDLTDVLGIMKWEAPVNAQLAGKQRGNFPYFIRKTDEERIQNIKKEITQAFANGDVFEMTLKLDGSSCTVYHKDGANGVCSRNIELVVEQEGNAFVTAAHTSGLIQALTAFGRNIAVQSELMGIGVQSNRENLEDHTLFTYKIWDIDAQKYLAPMERHAVLDALFDLGYNGHHVPVLDYEFVLPTDNIDELLKLAEGASLRHPVREGIVLKRLDGEFSFKIINNEFLLKEK